MPSLCCRASVSISITCLYIGFFNLSAKTIGPGFWITEDQCDHNSAFEIIKNESRSYLFIVLNGTTMEPHCHLVAIKTMSTCSRETIEGFVFFNPSAMTIHSITHII